MTSRLASASTATALVVGVAAVCGLYVLHNRKKKKAPKDTENEQAVDAILEDDKIPRDLLLSTDAEEEEDTKKRILSPGTITIAHASVTGTCLALAEKLQGALAAANTSATVQLCSTEDFDWWDELLNNDETEGSSDNSLPPIVVLILPTHSNGTWPTSALSLQTALQDLKHDWRIEKQPLQSSGLRVATFGMGSSAYEEATMGQPAKEAYRELRSLGARTIGVVGVGDDAVGNKAQEAFGAWMKDTVVSIKDIVAPSSSSCGCGSAPSDGCCKTNTEENEEEEYYSDEEEDQGEPELMDLEDMGDSMMAEEKKTSEVREMVTPSQAAALKKEGYRLIGTHSAVKLCRWTKHQLRGRGGCYKHTFYGITSYQCMEATPSLACANKCTYLLYLLGAFRSLHVLTFILIYTFRCLLLASSQESCRQGVEVEDG